MKNKFIALLYHSIGDYPDNEYDVSYKTFKIQMEYLLENGYVVEGFEAFYNRLNNKDLPERYALLTFDDGYKSFLMAGNYLNKIGFNGTFFLTKNWCNKRKNFLVNTEIKELSLSQEIGSHTISHIPLTKMPIQEIYYELSESKKWIEDLIQKKIISLSAPNGMINNKVIKAAKWTGYELIGASNEWWNYRDRIILNYLINRVAVRKSYSIGTYKKIINIDPLFYLIRKSRFNFLSILKFIFTENQYNQIKKIFLKKF
jgi:peptidoglycan/xylan/chitin deacetylase (PgdA/CDA1 family)